MSTSVNAILPRAFLGIDPGNSGGMVLLDPTGKVLHVSTFSFTEHDLWTQFVWMRKHYKVDVGIERVGGFISVGGVGVAVGPTMFTFGRSYGLVRGFTIASGFPFREILPHAWQSGLGIAAREKGKRTKQLNGKFRTVGGETSTKWKTRLKGVAQRLFPQANMSKATSDAYLIAEFLRRTLIGLSQNPPTDV